MARFWALSLCTACRGSLFGLLRPDSGSCGLGFGQGFLAYWFRVGGAVGFLVLLQLLQTLLVRLSFLLASWQQRKNPCRCGETLQQHCGLFCVQHSAVGWRHVSGVS